MVAKSKVRSTRNASLLGAAPLAIIAAMAGTDAQAAAAAASAGAEEILVTGSLIRGAEAVGVPVTALDDDSFRETAALSVAELLRSVPAITAHPSVAIQASGSNLTHIVRLNIHNFGFLRTLMLINGMRYPQEGIFVDAYDPSIVLPIALERVDVLSDGASATYGSDAVAGVINLVMRRRYEGARTDLLFSTADGKNSRLQASQLFGMRWDGGDVTASYEFMNEKPLLATERDYYTYNYTPYGLDDRTPIGAALPGVVSTGNPTSRTGTNCTNCFSIPKGTGWDFGSRAPGATTTWTALLANKGVTNLVNPYLFAEIIGPTRKNSFALTFDQKITDDVEFFADIFYANRRTGLKSSGVYNPNVTVSPTAVLVPTHNPYYPTGAPVGLRVSYYLSPEIVPDTRAAEVSRRVAAGFNVALPEEWNGRVFHSVNEEHNEFHIALPNLNHINAALGSTIAAINPVTGVAYNYSKPANVPYLNFFCDPLQYQCNSRQTLDYITGVYNDNSRVLLQETGANFDGPLTQLPGGTIRAAVGATYRTENVDYRSNRSYLGPTIEAPFLLREGIERKIYAVFGQVNIPLVGEMNAMPGIAALEVEVSGRYDHYDDFGGTTNPKLAANWDVFEGLTVRGSWGKSFRAPASWELSSYLAKNMQAQNLVAGGVSNAAPACLTVGSPAVAGSAAAFLNPTCTAALQFPGGVNMNGGIGGFVGVTRPSDFTLKPETASNYSLGFDFSPPFLEGLNVQAAYFNAVVKNILQQPAQNLNDPSLRSSFVLRGDDANNPVPYAQALAGFLANPLLPPTIVPANIQFIYDGGVRNLGRTELDGVDFSADYSFETMEFGIWDAGITGTYYLHQKTRNFAGAPIIDEFNKPGPTGLEAQAIRFRYRASLGWTSDFGLNVTGFLNYQSHYFHTNAYPPAASLVPFPNYSNHVPAQHTIDLAMGYDLGDRPANEYLKQISFQLVVNNIFDRDPPFVYRVANAGGSTAHDGTVFGPLGRTLSLQVSKTW